MNEGPTVEPTEADLEIRYQEAKTERAKMAARCLRLSKHARKAIDEQITAIGVPAKMFHASERNSPLFTVTLTELHLAFYSALVTVAEAAAGKAEKKHIVTIN